MGGGFVLGGLPCSTIATRGAQPMVMTVDLDRAAALRGLVDRLGAGAESRRGRRVARTPVARRGCVSPARTRRAIVEMAVGVWTPMFGRRARDLQRLLSELEQPSDRETQARSLLTLQTIAAMLVDASRRHAERLTREAGRRRSDDPEPLP
jgi:hypothetical protein